MTGSHDEYNLLYCRVVWGFFYLVWYPRRQICQRVSLHLYFVSFKPVIYNIFSYSCHIGVGDSKLFLFSHVTLKLFCSICLMCFFSTTADCSSVRSLSADIVPPIIVIHLFYSEKIYILNMRASFFNWETYTILWLLITEYQNIQLFMMTAGIHFHKWISWQMNRLSEQDF